VLGAVGVASGTVEVGEDFLAVADDVDGDVWEPAVVRRDLEAQELGGA